MKTILIRQSTKDSLKSLDSNDSMSMDSIVNMLLDASDKVQFEPDIKNGNIHLKEDTFNRLKQYRAYDNESYDALFTRLLDNYDK